jgi:hypothetical protein
MAQLEARFGPFRDSSNLYARLVHGLRQTGLRNCFAHPIELLGDVGHVECHFGLFGGSCSFGVR